MASNQGRDYVESWAAMRAGRREPAYRLVLLGAVPHLISRLRSLGGADLEMFSDPLVRRARLDEGLQVASVWLVARRAALPAIPAPVHSDDDVCRWFVEDVLPTQNVWVAEVDGCIVGLLVVDAGWVTQLYVDPSHQRQGLGSALLKRAKERSAEGLDLWTFETNVDSHRFYERHGFVLVDSTDGRDNEEQAPDRRYRWSR